ncbi:hypothetical protein QL285_093628 [Trifolium repens]|nr:hypothetical protein QL285_093628 [Trifolium repens]
MSSSNYKGFSHDPGGSSSHKRLRSGDDIDVYHQDRTFGYPIETSYVRSIASIRPRQLTFQDYGSPLITNANVNEITCTTNGEDYDIPNNEDYGASNDDVNLMLCASNTEEYDIPSNSDNDDLQESVDDHGGQMLIAPYLPPVDDPSFATYLNIGQPNCICSYCGAIMWLDERLKASPKKKPRFSLCCSQGDIELLPYTKLPHALHNLYHGLDKRSRMKDDDLAIRSSIVRDIREALDSCDNPYVRTYNTIRDTLHLDGIPTIRLRILGKRGRDGRRYNLPTASEVAALIVGDFDAADFERDVIVEERSGLLQRISTFKPSYWPLQYPLLFPRGEDGYRKDIEFRDNEKNATRKRQYITQLEWVGYRIQQREIENSTIVFSRRLFHQFLVDSFSTIESARLKYLRDHQQELRSDMYKGLTEAILRGETNTTSTGKRITWEELSDDIQRRQRRLMNRQDLVLTPDQLKNYALAEIDTLLQSNNKSLRQYPDMPQPDPGLLPDRGNRLIYDELNYDRESLVEEHHMLMSTMTTEQRKVYDKIMARIQGNQPGLHEILLKTPEPVLEDCLDERWKLFKNCLGELDGTHIQVNVPAIDKPRYRNRKGDISTNVLGWDAISRTNGLKVPTGYYYLVDAGYTNSEGFLAPYRGCRYHRSEWRHGYTTSNKKDLFNMKHSMARNVIERTFGLLKMHWAILRSRSFYPIKIQIRIINACCLLRNFIRREMPTDPMEEQLGINMEAQLHNEDIAHAAPINTIGEKT